MLPHLKKRLIKKHVIAKIGSFYYCDNFMVSEINEGVIVSLEMVLKVTNKYTKKYYPNNTPFVYIANRINSYSIQPTIHFETKKILPNVKGYGVITYNSINNKIATLEQSFLYAPTKIFDNLEEAILWVDELILHD
ncbi:hypothetical protein D1818_21800 [Aquimarina sp. BL5]|uniref:hypothetical protein n=1 Tax=Aquimarina sp. BL5 TaxID=1714860 RepID=UPI000E479D79|nr:hypothetical protein [Aquimarina sp. BL5]AXT53331.1 hypothetical protein D1818_21800 [Aquimarina sp. BL5]RKN02746.1 hypothetical protein D7036_15885 [Aquimarina sp. BL5]